MAPGARLTAPESRARPRRARGAWAWTAGAQAVYFGATGVWPIVHIGSFMAVTGPKTDIWLVQLFGALICVPAAVLLHALWRNAPSPAVFIAGAGSCAVLMAGDIIFVALGAIPNVYLLDAAAELVLLLGWAGAIVAERGRTPG